MINILAFSLEDIAVAIVHAFRWLFAILSGLIYTLIVEAYNLFTYLATLNLFKNEGLIGDISKRISLILGLFMVFKLLFSLVNAFIEPSKLTDKKNGIISIIIRTVISFVLLGIVPFIYKEAIVLQNLIVGGNNSNNNIIYKLIIGKNVPESDNFGRELAAELYFDFYRDDESPFLTNNFDSTDPDAIQYDKKVDEIKNKIIKGKESFYYPNQYLNMHDANKEYIIEYNELLSVGIGGLFLWMILMYCVQISIRVFQLAYLRLVAPIPILSYITDPDGAFKKWLKQCSTTYIDLFIRLAIMYFVIFFSNYVIDFFDELGDNAINVFAEVFLLVGLFMFANKVPKLLGEILPFAGGTASFDFGLKAPKPLANVTRFGAGMALGALGGGVSNLMHGGINSFKNFRKGDLKEGFKGIGKTAFSVVGGMGGGAVQGAKIKKFSFSNVGNAVKTSNENREKRELKAEAGYHWYNPLPTIQDKILGFAGEKTGAEIKIKEAENQLQAIEFARAALWKKAEDDVKDGFLDANKYSFIRGLEKTTDNRGNVFYSGYGSDGKKVTIAETDLGTDIRTSGYENMIKENAKFDEQKKQQNKKIKGLQTADHDAKK